MNEAAVMGVAEARGSVKRLSRWWVRLPAVAKIAALALVLTPAALVADYRLGLAPYDRLTGYHPIGEAGGRLVFYHQYFGWTQIVWIVAGIGIACLRDGRRAYRLAPALFLTALLLSILASTALDEGIDATTVVDLGATIVPAICIAAVLASVSVDLQPDLVFLFLAVSSLVVGLTLVKEFVSVNVANTRFDVVLFGAPTDTGLALAALLLLVPAVRHPGRWQIGLALVLGAALVATQTRGAFVSLVAGGAVMALLRRRQVPLILGSLVALVAAFAVLTTRSLAFQDRSVLYREENLRFHWHAFVERPFLGWGLNSSSIYHVRAAHNVLLGVMDAAGVLGLLLMVLAFGVPVVRGLTRGRGLPTTSIGVAVVAAVVVGWNTTGTELLLYTQPTNLIPLFLATALLVPRGVSARLLPMTPSTPIDRG